MMKIENQHVHLDVTKAKYFQVVDFEGDPVALYATDARVSNDSFAQIYNYWANSLVVKSGEQDLDELLEKYNIKRIYIHVIHSI